MVLLGLFLLFLSFFKIFHFLEGDKLDFANRGPSSQGYGFSSGHVWM